VLANIEDYSNARTVWQELTQEQKCGMFNLPYFYNKILGEFEFRHRTHYVVEVKVKLQDWATIYTFVAFKPTGLHLI